METETNSYRATGKSVDEAIFKGLQEMGISIDEVTIEIIQHETKGILGIGAKPAVVLLTQRAEEELDVPDYLQKDKRDDRRGRREKFEKKENREKLVRDKQEKPEKKETGEAPAKQQAPKPEKAEAKPVRESREKPEKKENRDNREKSEKPERREKKENREVRDTIEVPASITTDEPSAEELAAPAEPGKVLEYTREAAEGNPAAEFVEGLIARMGAEGTVLAAQDDDCLRLRIDSEMMGMLIGHRGETLDAMQYLTGLVVNKNRKTEGYKRITLNTEEYREKREETLKRLAKKVAAQVRATGRPRALEPMNPYERRVLHSTLQNNPDVTTHSEGEEPNRRVVVTPRRPKVKSGYQKTKGGRRNERRPAERRPERRAEESSDNDVLSREEYERIYEAAKKGALSKEMFEEIAGRNESSAAAEE
jgi:spoIIIJ-associated protein